MLKSNLLSVPYHSLFGVANMERSKKNALFLALWLTAALACTVPSRAATISVDVNGNGLLTEIQPAIDAAETGDTILVKPGEYVITEPISFLGKAITVQSEAGPDATFIRMGTPTDTNRGSVVVFESNETAASVLEGFTITGGTGSSTQSSLVGGGIFFNDSSGTVKNCAIVHNSVEDSGGGVFCAYPCSPILIDCIIAENSARVSSGGGVFAWSGSSLTLNNCIVRGNSATEQGGGGVCCYLDSSVTMTYCTIAENFAGMGGGGVFCGENSSSVTMSHCAIVGNTAGLGGGGLETWRQGSATVINCVITQNTVPPVGWGGGGVVCSQGGGSATIINSILWENTAPKGHEIWVRTSGGTLSISYSNVAGGQAEATIEGGTINWGEGNIDTDPYFAEPGYWADVNDPSVVVEPDDPGAVWIDGDYRLKSEAGRWDPGSDSWVLDDITSLCIDAGDPDSDWKAELWPHGIRANMGAYGGTLQASRSLSDAGNIADLNRDGIVDSADMCIMVDYWHTDEPSCDVAPPAFGDGIVDVQDLVVLAENLFEDYRQVAHWKLNETEGDVAYDSAGVNDGILNGNPLWRPIDGKLDGALQFDGIDDYIDTAFILNPTAGPFSVFVWINGGAPGQTILCQQDALSEWLSIDAAGALTSALTFPLPVVTSDVVITDDQWHHIGLVSDGAGISLYVDDVEVARSDTSPILPAYGDLHIGAGNNLEPSTFFSGMIDDVRIYDRVVVP